MATEEFKLSEWMGNPFVAGACGSLLGLKSMPGATWLQRLWHLIVGATCAGYGAPALYEWLHMNSPSMFSFLSFAVGAFGISVFMAVGSAISTIDWAGILTSFLPRGPR